MNYRIEYIAYRDKLDLGKLADRSSDQEKLFAKDPGLHKHHADANVLARF